MAIREVTTKICTCDLCHQEVPSEEQLKSLQLPVKFLTEQTEGRACSPYFINRKFDLCEACLEAVTVVLGEGAQGHNRYWMKKDTQPCNHAVQTQREDNWICDICGKPVEETQGRNNFV